MNEKHSIFKRTVSFFLIFLMVILSALCVSSVADDQINTDILSEYKGKKIGVLTGSSCADAASEMIEDCTICYYNAQPDVAVALDKKKIDAYVADEPIAKYLCNEYTEQEIVSKLTNEEYAYIFSKHDEKSTKLCEELSAFIKESRENGLLDALNDKWFGTDEDAKIIDYSPVKSGDNGSITFATSSEIGAPFTYLNDGDIVGYDIELVVEFCKSKGYALKVDDYKFLTLFNAVQSGFADFAGCCITVTEERKESVLFSEPSYVGGLVLVANKIKKTYNSIDELVSKKIGVVTGSIFDVIAEQSIKDCKVEYYNTYPDLSEALLKSKIDAYITAEPIANFLNGTKNNQRIIARLNEAYCAMFFKKDDEWGSELCEKMNAFLKKSTENGNLQTWYDEWVRGPESGWNIDFENVQKGTNGELIYSACSSVGVPFCFMKDGNYAGYEIELAVEFCKEYGYTIKIDDYFVTGIIASVQTGISDFGGACTVITDERKESVLFADPEFSCAAVVVVSNLNNQEEKVGFVQKVIDSFKKTFIREGRWKLFAKGVGNTMVITVASIIFGIIIGLFLFMICRNGNKVSNIIVKILFTIIQRTPMVVLLMILFYLVFGSTNLGGIWVSIIGFTLTFMATTFKLLKASVMTIEKGQYEAAYSLGFGSTHTFFKIILPQTMPQILPLLKSEVVSHIKATAIVGYIAVADLTRMSDIVRTRTYEAFFPLIATAIIYFLLEGLLIFIVDRIEINCNVKRRSQKRILKGIKTSEN